MTETTKASLSLSTEQHKLHRYDDDSDVKSSQPPLLSSNLSSIFTSYQSKLQQIDYLEHKLEEKVVEKRQRALNLLDEMSNIRHSTLRIFVSHEHEDVRLKPVRIGKSNDGIAIDGNKDKVDGSSDGNVNTTNGDGDQELGSATIPSNSAPKGKGKGLMQLQKQHTMAVKESNHSQQGPSNNNKVVPVLPQCILPKTKKQPLSKWKLLIEGKQLIPPIDHIASNLIDQDKTTQAAQQNRQYVTQNTDIHDTQDDMTSREKIATRFVYDREGEDILQPMLFTYFWDKISVSFQPYARQVLKPLTDLNEDNENDNNDDQLTDKNTVKKRKRSSAPSSSSAIPASRLKLRELQQQSLDSTFKQNGQPTILTWNRLLSGSPTTTSSIAANNNGALMINQQNANNVNNSSGVNSTNNTSMTVLPANQDSHAFHVVFEQEEELPQANELNSSTTNDEIMTEYMVVATIRLHRRTNFGTTPTTSINTNHLQPPSQSMINPAGVENGTEYHEQKYKLSKVLLNTLFTTFLPKTEGIGANITTSQTAEETHTTLTPPMDNDIFIPKVFTIDEILTAFYIYICDNNLLASASGSIHNTSQYDNETTTSAVLPSSTDTIKDESSTLVYNDTKLQSIFNQPTMYLHDIKNLLVSKNLIIPSIVGTPGDAPIVLTYIMKKENSCTNPLYIYDNEVETNKKTSADDGAQDAIKKEEGSGDNVKEETVEDQPPSKRSKTQKQSKPLTDVDPIVLPNLLSCDIDIDVPHFYHSRTRDILRRIKIREYEYASCRTKALRTIQQTGVNENDAKILLEDVVKGNGLTKDHIPVCLALAKSAQEGSEARIGSHIDARISMLMGRLEQHTKNAQACWDLVKHCRNALNLSDTSNKK